jgi:D-glucosaminate-6-phosphate ammonia-lyase
MVAIKEYEKLGISRIINCFDTYTLLGGSILSEEVRYSMVEADKSHVWLWELYEKSGKKIAELTGAEAAVITPGAFAALSMSAAVCMAGSDPEKMKQLPNSVGMKNEFIIQRCLRDFQYDRSMTVAGGKLIEVGNEYSGCTPEQIEAAIGDNTAAIHYFAHGTTGSFASKDCHIVPLENILGIARQHNIPVLVDAAFQCYPLDCLSKFADMGADAIAYSCKYFGGPNTAGLLLGKKKLVDSVKLHSFIGQEGGPRGNEFLSEAERAFYSSVFRGYKQDRSSIIGSVVALERYMRLMKDPDKALQPAREKVDFLVRALQNISDVKITIMDSPDRVDPLQIGLQLTLMKKTAKDAFKITKELMNENPAIWLKSSKNNLIINVTSFRGLELLCDGDEKIIANRLRKILSK